MSVKGLIFDLDGVIVSTEQNHYQSWTRIAELIGARFDDEINEQIKGVSRKDSLQLISDRSGITLDEVRFNELLKLKNTFYRESIADLSRKDILTGVLELVERAKERGLKVMIGSSSRNARVILDKLGLLETFDHVVDGNDVERAKPDPEIFTKGAKLAGLSPSQCVVFEDAASGIEAARLGGFRAIGVGNPDIKHLGDEYLNDLNEFEL